MRQKNKKKKKSVGDRRHYSHMPPSSDHPSTTPPHTIPPSLHINFPPPTFQLPIPVSTVAVVASGLFAAVWLTVDGQAVLKTSDTSINMKGCVWGDFKSVDEKGRRGGGARVIER